MIRQIKYKVKRAIVEVCEDSYTEGEGEFCNEWHESLLEGNEYDTIEDLFKGIEEETYLFSSNPADYVYMEDEGRIDTDATVTADNDKPSGADFQMWRNGDIMLYNAHLMCWVEVIDTTYMGDDEVDSKVRPIDESDFVGFDINFG